MAAAVGAERGITSRKLKAISQTGRLLNARQISRRNRAKKGCLYLLMTDVGAITRSIVEVLCPPQLCEKTLITQKRLPGHIWMFTYKALMLTIGASLSLRRVVPSTLNAVVRLVLCACFLCRGFDWQTLIPLCSVKSSVCVPQFDYQAPALPPQRRFCDPPLVPSLTFPPWRRTNVGTYGHTHGGQALDETARQTNLPWLFSRWRSPPGGPHNQIRSGCDI